MPVHLGAERRAPWEWESECGFLVTNPIGWRRRGIEWDRPITCDAFVLMSQDSILKVTSVELAAKTGVITLPSFEDRVLPKSDPDLITRYDAIAYPTFDQLLTGQITTAPAEQETA